MTDEALESMGRLDDPRERAWALIAYARALGGGAADHVVQLAIEAAHQISTDYLAAKAMVGLVDLASPQQMEEVLRTVEQRVDAQRRISMLVVVATHLPTGTRQRLLDEVLSEQDENRRAFWLERTAAALDDTQLRQALSAAHFIVALDCRARALTGLVNYVRDPDRRQLITAAFDALIAYHGISERTTRSDTIAGLATSRLLPHLNRTEVDVLTDITAAKSDPVDRTNALIQLLPHLHNDQVDRALEIARRCSLPSLALAHVAARFGGIHQPAVDEAIAAAASEESDGFRVEALSHLAPVVTGWHIDMLLDLAAGMDPGAHRDNLLEAFASRMDASQTQQAQDLMADESDDEDLP